MDMFLDYQPTILVMGLSGLLLLVQVLIADVASIKAKHTPGYPVAPDHGSFLFRATRVYNNANETIAAFVLIALFGMLSGADASYLNGFAVAYFVGRVIHMLCYYAKLGLPRSLAFVLSVVGLVGMFVSGCL